MNLDFTPDEADFRAEAREWLQTNVPRRPRSHDGKLMLEFDREWQRRQYEGGWAGVSWPTEYGGRGLSLIQQLIWYEEYARADAPLPVASAFFVALMHAGPTVIAKGTDEQKAFYLPKILQGETVWCQGFSEPGAGSDLANLRTRAEVDGDHLVVNGSKIWTSRAQHATYQELLVRTDPTAAKHKGITWVIGDMTLPGIDVRPIPCMHGASHFCEVFYDNVRIPLKNVVGDINDGWNVAMATLGFERGTSALAEQIMMSRVVERLIEMARQRVGPDGVRPAIQDDEIIVRLATLRAEVAALRAMSYASISRAQRNFVPGSEGTIIGTFNSEMLQRIFRMANDLLGPEALDFDGSDEHWVYEYQRSIMTTIGGGTSEIRRNIIGERLLGLPRDR